MNNKKKILTVIFFLIILSGCSNYNGRVDSGHKMNNLQKIFIDEIDLKNSILTTSKTEIEISGNLPSPAYTFNGFDVKVKGKTIEITPLADLDTTKMAAQVLVPFRGKCNIENLKPGNYEVKVLGRGDAVIQTMTVESRQD